MSNVGFNYSKTLMNPRIIGNISKISENSSLVEISNVQQVFNGANQNEFLIPNFFSENNNFISNPCNSFTRNNMIASCCIGSDQQNNLNFHELNEDNYDDEYSEEYSSEDDDFDLFRDDEILKELQKLSSEFKNVFNISVVSGSSNNSDVVDVLNMSHSSRFKKTRFRERISYWNNGCCIVKDNLMKVIPEEIRKISFIDNERLNQFKKMFDDDISKDDYGKEKILSPPECIHSLTGKDLRHSHRHSKRQSRIATEFPHPSEYLQKPNSSRSALHRRSLQIPIQVPLVVNKFIPVLSPVISQCNRQFCHNKVNRNKRNRRWSISCGRLDKEAQHRKLDTNINYENYINKSSQDSKHVLETHSEEISENDIQTFIDSFKSSLDYHLICLKQTLLTHFDLSLRDVMNELQSMKDNEKELRSQLVLYKNKLDFIEHSVKNRLPENEWESYGVTGGTGNNICDVNKEDGRVIDDGNIIQLPDYCAF